MPAFPQAENGKGQGTHPEPIKYVIVNADEGDPGALYGPERSLKEIPIPILEGLIIGGYAISDHMKAIFMFDRNILWR